MEESIRRNLGAVSQMRSLLRDRTPEYRPPVIPPNPIVNTNAILGRVEEHISRMARISEASAELQTTLNDYARSAIMDMKVGSDQTERSAKLALWVGLAVVATGLIGAAVSVLTWLWTADQQVEARAIRVADAKTSAQERQADRELLRQQLDAMRKNADVLEKRLPSPDDKAREPANVSKSAAGRF